MTRVRCHYCLGVGSVPVPTRFSDRCRFERERRGLQYREAAAAIGVSVGTLHRVEHGGKPGPRNAAKIARFYGFKLRVQVTL